MREGIREKESEKEAERWRDREERKRAIARRETQGG